MKIAVVVSGIFLQWLVLGGVGHCRGGRGEVVFNRNDRVLTWKTGHSGEYFFSDRLNVRLNSLLSTSLNMATRGAKDRWYDTVNNGARLTYRLTDRMDFLVSAQEDWNKDTMSRLGNRLFTTNLDGGIRYRPFGDFLLEGSAGHIYDNRFGNEDKGAKLEGGVRCGGTPFRNVFYNLDINGEKAKLRRARDSYRGTGSISYKRDSVTAALIFSDDYNRRGYFSDIDRCTVERRKRREKKLLLSVMKGDFGNIGASPALEFTVNLGRKLITDTANDDERSTKYKNNARGRERGFGLRYGRSLGRRVAAELGVEYGKVANGVERLSRRRTQTDVGTRGVLYWGMGKADSIAVAGMLKRTRIDTPVGVANDRDELKYEGGVTYIHRFSETFETALDFRVLETHYVNIDVSQSSQNKWMKTYLFSPSLVYSPARSLRIEHTVNVYANYIVYDYDRDYAPRSNISRRLTSESWMDWSLAPDTVLKLGVMFEDNDYGLLNSRGQKLPAEEGLRRFGNVSIDYRFSDWLMLTPSYIYAVRRDWQVTDDDTRPIRREVDQTFGLSCRLFQRENGGIVLSLKRIVRTTRKYPVRIRDYVTMRMSYGF